MTLTAAGAQASFPGQVDADPALPPGGALDGQRHRLIVTTDIGGRDPDDFQSMVHLLLYADVLEIEGLISSPPFGGRVSDILETIDAYAQDYPNLVRHSPDYPSPDYLRSVSFQGAIDHQAGAAPSPDLTPGARHIIERAKAVDERPLYIAVWGAITDVAQAVQAEPSIKSRIRVYSIGSWNTIQDESRARDYLYQNHPDLWWIENDTTFRGMYIGGEQEGDLGNLSFVEQHVRGHGALGDFFHSRKPDIKMGDTPSILYLLRGDPDDPTAGGWGGRFVRTGHSPTFWTDDPDPAAAEPGTGRPRPGARSVNSHRTAYLRDWQARMDRVLSPGGSP